MEDELQCALENLLCQCEMCLDAGYYFKRIL
jgi:hypothetical protein